MSLLNLAGEFLLLIYLSLTSHEHYRLLLSCPAFSRIAFEILSRSVRLDYAYCDDLSVWKLIEFISQLKRRSAAAQQALPKQNSHDRHEVYNFVAECSVFSPCYPTFKLCIWKSALAHLSHSISEMIMRGNWKKTSMMYWSTPFGHHHLARSRLRTLESQFLISLY